MALGPSRTKEIAIVGAGPRGVGVLERLVASARELLEDEPVVVHLVDPYPPGAGRVWRDDQSALMLLNSMAQDITVWTDSSVVMEGPVRPGPTLDEWAAQVAAGGLLDASGRPDAALSAEARAVTPVTFASRRLQRAYLAWFFEQVVQGAPPFMGIVVHQDRAMDVTDGIDGDGGQVIELASGGRLEVDAVVLAMGHLDRAPAGQEAAHAQFATRHDRSYLPPSYTADEDLGLLRAGEDVIVSGFGLAFVDLMALVTEGRGGTFVPDGGDGRLGYRPSGREPRLWVGSRRGVPYRAKLTYDLRGGRPQLPRYLAPAAVDALVAGREQIEFWPDLWPLVAKELAWGYYRELVLGHPDRVVIAAGELDRRFEAAAWGSEEMDALVASAIPDPVDRLDLAHLDRPLAGLSFADRPALEAYVASHVEQDLARRADPHFSADLGLFWAALSAVGSLRAAAVTGRLTSRSRLLDLDGWWWGFFSYYASGPPPRRLEELLALQRAGVVSFLGADLRVEADEGVGIWRATSTSVPEPVEAGALVDARLPAASVRLSRDPVIRSLHRRGEAVEEVLRDPDGFAGHSGYLSVAPDGRIVGRDGTPHPRRFAIGANTSSGRGGAFARPRTNGVSFRQNDQVARSVLRLVATPAPEAALAD